MIAIIPKQLAAARTLAGLTQKQLAELSGVGTATIKRLEASTEENNNFDGVRLSTLKKLIDAFEALGIKVEATEEFYTIKLRRK